MEQSPSTNKNARYTEVINFVQMARENPSGYDRIVCALANLGRSLSDPTVGNILGRQGNSPAPKRKQTDFIRSYWDVCWEWTFSRRKS
jgi:hypothetical protein